MCQPRGKVAAVALAELGFDRPVFLRDKCLDGGFTLTDQAQRYRLHPAGRAGAGKFAPQHGRDRKSDEIVQRTARPIGVDQFGIQFARLCHRGQDGVLCHLVEYNPLDRLVLDQSLVLQQFQNMPADRLALAVGVSGEDQTIGGAKRRGDFPDAFLRPAGDLPLHRKIFVRKDRSVLAWQVTDMPIARQNLVVITKVAVDGFGFCWGFDDYKFHDRPCFLNPADSM